MAKDLREALDASGSRLVFYSGSRFVEEQLRVERSRMSAVIALILLTVACAGVAAYYHAQYLQAGQKESWTLLFWSLACIFCAVTSWNWLMGHLKSGWYDIPVETFDPTPGARQQFVLAPAFKAKIDETVASIRKYAPNTSIMLQYFGLPNDRTRVDFILVTDGVITCGVKVGLCTLFGPNSDENDDIEDPLRFEDGEE